MDNKQERSLARRRLRRRRRIKRLVKALVVLTLLALLGGAVLSVALPAIRRAAPEKGTEQAQRSTAQAYVGTIEKTVFGSGSVQPVSQRTVFAGTDGTVKRTLVGLGDAVKAGDVLMVLENDSLAHEKEELEYALFAAQQTAMDTETYDRYRYEVKRDPDTGRKLRDEETGKYVYEQYSNELSIRSPSAGRVMAVYIEEGDDALAVYREHGAVILLSTDGRMKVEMDVADGVSLTLGETVQVTGSGVSAKGTVIDLLRRGTQAVIQVNGDTYPMDVPVTVTTADGQTAGEGILEINKPMAVSAYGGEIKGVTVNVGSQVKREDVLARFTWDGMPLYLENASALLAHAKAKVSLEATQKKLDALVVTAPCDGQIASVDVSGDAAVTDGTALMSIVEDAGMSLVLSVDELDIVAVQTGQRAVMELDALSDVTLTGTVEKIAPLGNTETAVTTYDVYIALDEVDPRVKGGMNVSGEIIVSTAQNAVIIPMDALKKVNGAYNVTLEDGSVRQVVTGIMTRDNVEILSGLSAGETVVY